jgi:hypothetical protein
MLTIYVNYCVWGVALSIVPLFIGIALQACLVVHFNFMESAQIW